MDTVAAHLDPADPAAVALGYHEDTTDVDGARFPQHNPSQICGDCLYRGGNPRSEWGRCAVFAGRGLVRRNGWCAAYVRA